MKITYDPDKRARALQERGLDFEDAERVFDGVTVDMEDIRKATANHASSASVICKEEWS